MLNSWGVCRSGGTCPVLRVVDHNHKCLDKISNSSILKQQGYDGLEHSKKSHVAANFKKLNETNKSKMCVRLMKKTLQQMSEMMNESHSQINSTNAKTSAKTSSKKKDEKREYKYVLAKDSKLDARGKSEREWRDWVSDIQCVKCNKYGHYSPDCPEQ